MSAVLVSRSRALARAFGRPAQALQQALGPLQSQTALQTNMVREVVTEAEAPPATRPNMKDGKVTHPDMMNANLVKAEYAVRGELYNRAQDLAKEGKEVIYTNGTFSGGQRGLSGWWEARMGLQV